MPDDTPPPAAGPEATPPAPAPVPAAPGGSAVGRELAVYTALRVGLIAVLAVLLRFSGLLWLPAIALAVVAAALLSFVLLRRPMQRLAGAVAGRRAAATPRSRAGVPGAGDAAAGGTGRPGGPVAGPGGQPAPAAYDPYEDDLYADEDEDDEDGPAQDARTRANPTSSP